MRRNRPKYKPELAEQLPSMFNNGETAEGICLKLGIDEKTFEEWKAQYPDFNYAAKRGEIRAECFYEDLLAKSTLGKLNSKDFDEDSLIELMQKRFPETYK